MQGIWQRKAFNTFFDYWRGTKLSQIKSGKVISGWKDAEEQSGFTGGSPPSLDDISSSDKGSVNKFVDCLLGHNVHIQKDVKRILIANVIR